MDKKCVLCGKPAEFESMKMASPVCEDCAKALATMWMKNMDFEGTLEDAMEELFVPAAGDITEIREAQ